MPLMRYLYNQIKASFEEHPRRFFTEHDIHSELALIATDFLKNKGNLQAKTLDGFVVNRVHHEYPTPFRCLMKGSEFRLVSEEEFRRQKWKSPSFRARRGYVDLVIFNLEYVSSNKLSIVSGKRYRDFRASLSERRGPALDLAVEVVYFPTFDDKPHNGIMNRRVSSTIQDYKKLVELMRFAVPNNIPFCKEAAMIFFSNTRYDDYLNKKFSSFPLSEKVEFFRILCASGAP